MVVLRSSISASVEPNPNPAKAVDLLAVRGGVPVRTAPVPPWPSYDQSEIDAVAAVLASGKVNQWTGTSVADFEAEFAAYSGRRYSVAVANGSVALEIALKALGIGPGCDVIVPCRSFIATASSVCLVGARPVFADVDFDSQNISVQTIEGLVTAQTRAIIVVHLNGRPCDMPEIMQYARARGLLVIEDCAQGLGARIDGRPVGSHGDVAAFSFCQDKVVSTGGEGGMIATDGEAVRNQAWSFKDHGKSRDLALSATRKPGFVWLHETIGTNARMTGMQAEIGRKQLAKLDGWVSTRNANADRLSRTLSSYGCVRIPSIPPGYTHARYRLEVTIDPSALAEGWSRDEVIRSLNAEGIAAFSGPCPEIYREVAFAGEDHFRRPTAQRLGEESLMLLVHPTLDESYLADCEAAFAKVFTAASR
jgi:dTDP-4-amino-4,6-dideoxygalactose transaminase